MRINKIISLFMCVMTVLSCCAASSNAQQLNIELSNVKAALLIDADSKRVIVDKAAGESIDYAGLTRLAPLLLVCMAFDDGRIAEDTQITVSKAASHISGQTAFISENEVIAAGELLKASVILLAGDAIYALIQKAYGSDQIALDEMNKYCTLQYSEVMGGAMLLTADFIADISLKLTESPSFLKYSSTYMDELPHANAQTTELVNPNRLVRHYSGCFGLATGSNGAKDYAGAFIVKRGTTTLLAIIGGAGGSDVRFETAQTMLDSGFAAFRTVSLNEQGAPMGFVSVSGGTETSVMAITASQVTALMPVTDTALSTETEMQKNVAAPVAMGQTLGKMILKNSNGEIVGEVLLVAAYSIDKASFGDYFMKILLSWLKADD